MVYVINCIKGIREKVLGGRVELSTVWVIHTCAKVNAWNSDGTHARRNIITIYNITYRNCVARRR